MFNKNNILVISTALSTLLDYTKSKSIQTYSNIYVYLSMYSSMYLSSMLRYLLLAIMCLTVMASSLMAAPGDKIITHDKFTVFFCAKEVHDSTLKPIRTGPGILDYCNDIKLNTKHYSSQDDKLRQQCPSKSVYRVVSNIGQIDVDGVCSSQEIKWYCDPVAKITDLKLPINTLYCPDELPADYLNKNILVCPKTLHNTNNTKLLAGGIAIDSFYCDNISVDVVHYVAEDQTLVSSSTPAQLTTVSSDSVWGAQIAKDCPSKSAYRVLTYKGEMDKNGKCHVTYDVYCDPQTLLKSPIDSRICPVWSTEKKEPSLWPTSDTQAIDWPEDIDTEMEAETETKVEQQVLPCDQAQSGVPCTGSPCGQVPLCGSGCDGVRMMPYTGYYMMQCQPGTDCSGTGIVGGSSATTTTTTP